MSNTRIPSPARSQGRNKTPRHYNKRASRSLGSPARSDAPGRLTLIINNSIQTSPIPSPLPSRCSLLTDSTYIDQPKNKNWWERIDENCKDVLELLQSQKVGECSNNIEEIINMDVLSQEKDNHLSDLPESSDSESIHSIVLPQRKIFTQKEVVLKKKYGKIIENRESLAKLQKINSGSDITVNAGTRKLLQNNRKQNKPIFPAGLLSVSINKTTDNTAKDVCNEASEDQVRILFGKRPPLKRKNMFAEFILSESEEEIQEIQDKKLESTKVVIQNHQSSSTKYNKVRLSAASITADIDMEDWTHLPSSTMVDQQIEEINIVTTPRKFSQLLEVQESEQSNKLGTSNNVSKETETTSENNHSSKHISKNKSLDSVGVDENLEEKDNKSQSQSLQRNASTNVTKHQNTYKILEDCNTIQKNNFINEKELEQKEHAAHKNVEQYHDEIRSLTNTGINENVENQAKTSIVTGNHVNVISDQNVQPSKEHQNTSMVGVVKKLDTEAAIQISDKIENEAPKLNSEVLYDDIDNLKEINQEPDTEKLMFDNEDEDDQNDSEYSTNHSKKSQNESVKVGCHTDNKQTMNIDINDDENNENNPLNETTQRANTGHEDSEKEMDVEVENNIDNQSDEANTCLSDNKQTMNIDINDDENNENNSLYGTIQIPNTSHEVSEKETEVAVENNIDNQSDEANTCLSDNKQTMDTDINDDGKNENNPLNKTTQTLNTSQKDSEKETGVEVKNNIDNQSDEANTCLSDNKQTMDIDINDDEKNENNSLNETTQAPHTIHEDSEKEIDVGVENNIDNESNEANTSLSEEDITTQAPHTIHEDSEKEMDVGVENNIDSESNEANTSLSEEDISEDDQNCEEEQSCEEEQNQSSNVENEDSDNNEDALDNYENTVTNNNDNSAMQKQRSDVTDSAKSPEVILRNKSNRMDSFTKQGRNTSIRKSLILKSLLIRPSVQSAHDSAGLSDGTKNSSAEGSAWDSHRTTRKTLRQTFGKDFSPRKSLRTLVMEKSAKRETAHIQTHTETINLPRANSTELPESFNQCHDDESIEQSTHDISKKMRQTKLQVYLQQIVEKNKEIRKEVNEDVKNFLKILPPQTNKFKVPKKRFLGNKCPVKPKVNMPRQKTPLIPLGNLPPELLEDMNYKPPKRFKPSNAPWITKRLYNYLEKKLESKYDYKARVRSEKLVETIYYFTKSIGRHEIAPTGAVQALKHEMARLDIVKTHFEFYNFFFDFMPRDIRVKVVPDIVNKIEMPKHGIFSNIIMG